MSGYGAGALVVGAGADATGRDCVLVAGFDGVEAARDGAFQTTGGADGGGVVALGAGGGDGAGGGLDTRRCWTGAGWAGCGAGEFEVAGGDDARRVEDPVEVEERLAPEA